MTAMDLLETIGSIKDQYILEASSGAHSKRHISIRRTLLIAAVVALMLLLVGCAVIYVLRMQDMKVGEYRFYVPTEYDENGNVIPVESQEPITLLSLQGTNMEALAEWVAFTNTYDQDLSVAHEADMAAKAGSPWDIPENYQLTYGCYSQEMVDKLNEIVEKYDLKLLSSYIPLNYYENSVLLNSLGLNGLVYANPNVQVEYWDGDFHLEGTFDLNMYISMDMGDWKWERGSASFRYSLKDYFDSLTGCMLESIDYTQWDYTRKDGEKVLLVLSEGTARIYANLPDAFISISLDPVIWVDGEKVPMTQTALEQFAELFDLSVKPQPTTMEQVEKQKADAQAQYEAERAEARAEHEAKYITGYQEFADYRLKTMPNPEEMSYILYDVNGDGVEELVINGLDILSIRDGQSYKYFDLNSTGVVIARFQPCEGNIFEVYCEDWGMYQHYFYQANAESASFLTGVTYNAVEDAWYLILKDGVGTESRQPTTAEEARKIVDSYTRIDFDWLPLKKFGEPVVSLNYTDPYAKYIANKLDRYDNAENYEYTLMDVNGDGVDELITREEAHKTDGTAYPILCIHSIRDSKLWDMNMGTFAYVCEGGILEETLDFLEDDDRGEYWQYYRCTENGAEPIEKIVRDPYTLYWGRVQAGKDGRTVTEEEAMSVLNSYKRIELDMKPFPEYPLT